MADLLSDGEIANRLPPEWVHDGEEIVRTVEFDDYLDGIRFALDVGELAEEEFHHPSIVIDYGEVTVRFTSHEEGGITDRDIEMAELVSELA